jgi:hypothetical protein
MNSTLRRYFGFGLGFASACLLCACQSTTRTDAGAAKSSGGGWISMFNGKDLTGWTPKFVGCELGVNYRNTFQAEDGVLRVCYDDYESFDGRFGHLFYATEYSSYIMRLEYRFVGEQVPGGPGWAYRNNGVMIHGQSAESMGLDQSFPVSIEVQMLGGDGEHERSTGNLCTPGTHVVMDGELITRHVINSDSPTFHGDQWVRLEIEVHGGEAVRHFINGDLVLEYQNPQLDPNDKDARAWMNFRGDDALPVTGGTISLQAESHGCEFRNIRIRPLEE